MKVEKYLAWAIREIIFAACWFGLAFYFGKWWIALFAILTMTVPRAKTHMVCDGCGCYSPYAPDHKTAIEEARKVGWIRRKNGEKWDDFCPECQARWEKP